MENIKGRLKSAMITKKNGQRKSAVIALWVVSSFSLFFGCSRTPDPYNANRYGNGYSNGGVYMQRQPNLGRRDSSRTSTNNRSAVGKTGTNSSNYGTHSGSHSNYSTYYSPRTGGTSSGSSSGSTHPTGTSSATHTAGTHSEAHVSSGSHSSSGSHVSTSHSSVSRGGFGSSSHSSSS